MARAFVLLSLSAAVAAPSALAAQTPAAFSVAVHAAAKEQQSVHYVSHSKTSKMEVTIVADSAKEEGIQQITIHSGAKSGHATVIVSGGVAYLRGDTFALNRFLGFKTTASIDYAGQWMRIPPTSAAYVPIAAAVTLGSAIDELGPQGTLSYVKASGLRGVRGTIVQKGVRIVDTLYARSSGTPLPVREVVTRPGVVATNDLSGWNEPVHVTVPTKTVPISTVLKAGGPSA
ncbi:MAG: hypothetical protein JO073_01440 [Actinobacteria bacterium]|nr:hypothetical protein [Actinomycetota bacterium]